MRATKIFRVENKDSPFVLCGFAGCCYDAANVRLWMEGKIMQPSVSNVHAIAIDRSRHVWVTEEKLVWVRVPNKWAIGSGADFALAAMACNRSAKGAIEVANKFDQYTGRGILMLRFKP
jgi:ATP-dependent protease HslVU (ClpYQ) peptidase subunit